MAFDVYQAVTDRIIKTMEEGTIPWTKPWVGINECAVKYRDSSPYSLLNQLLLGEAGEYISFKECEERGGHVKKGAKSKFVVFWSMNKYDMKDSDGNVIRDENGEPMKKVVPLLRYYNVFHIRDCEGIESKQKVETFETDPIEEAEKVSGDYLNRSGVRLENVAGDRACYSPSLDRIKIPNMNQFKDAEEYYSTLFHEEVHSTGHKTRLNRLDGSIAAFGDEDYSKEELVAELGACMILNILGIESKNTFRNSTAYLQGWLKALKNDKKLIVSAAGKAEKAVEMIMGQA